MATDGPDLIVSELLSELHSENSRKDQQIQRLIRALVAVASIALSILLVVVSGFLWYLNQYDFTSSSVLNATGVYTIVDSEGNVLSTDLTGEELAELVQGLSIYGESN